MIDLDKISDQHKREAIAGCFSDDNPLKNLVFTGLFRSPGYQDDSFSESKSKQHRWVVLKVLIKNYHPIKEQ